MKKTILTMISLIFGIMVVGCNTVTNNDGANEKNELLNAFFTEMYSFTYNKETDTKQILEGIKPFLSSDSSISEKEINNLVVNPAISKKVSVSYSSFSIKEESKKTIDNKNLDSILVYVDVLVKPNGSNEEYTKKQEVIVNLVNENNKLKVDNLEYLADDDLFAKYS